MFDYPACEEETTIIFRISYEACGIAIHRRSTPGLLQLLAGPSSACFAVCKTVRLQEVDHLTARIRISLRVVAESHPEDRAVWQTHVKGVWATRVDHEPEEGRRCGLRSFHLLTKAGWRYGVCVADEHEERGIKMTVDVGLAPRIQRDPCDKWLRALQRGTQRGQHCPSAIRHTHDRNALRIDIRRLP